MQNWIYPVCIWLEREQAVRELGSHTRPKMPSDGAAGLTAATPPRARHGAVAARWAGPRLAQPVRGAAHRFHDGAPTHASAAPSCFPPARDWQFSWHKASRAVALPPSLTRPLTCIRLLLLQPFVVRSVIVECVQWVNLSARVNWVSVGVRFSALARSIAPSFRCSRGLTQQQKWL